MPWVGVFRSQTVPEMSETLVIVTGVIYIQFVLFAVAVVVMQTLFLILKIIFGFSWCRLEGQTNDATAILEYFAYKHSSKLNERFK